MTLSIVSRRGLAAVALAATPLSQAIAATSDATDADSHQTLNPLVVTATLAPRTADESLASVSVLDEATLRRQDPTSLTDLLRGQPGVDVTSNGSFGKTSSVYIRGTSSNQSLLMIDGIRLRSATLGSAAWQFLDPRMFERAEIVRGPRGSLYGADAVGGVIQLFTPEGEAGAPTPRISLGGGSFDTRRYSASLSGASGGTRYYFAGSHFSTDGVPVVRDGDDKGYDNTSGLVRLSHTFDSGAELGLLALRARGSTEYDEFGPANDDFVQQVAGIYGELPITHGLRSRLTLSEARDEQDNHPAGTRFATRSQTVNWQNTFNIGPHELIAGAEYLNDKVDGSETFSGPFDEESRYNYALFTQALMDFAPVTMQASLRYDDNEAFGEEVTGSLALGYDLDSHHTLRASYGTAFRAPTFNDLFFPFTDFGFGFTFAGNPDLEAETSSTAEVGIRGQYGRYFWDLAAYHTEVDDLIVLGDNSMINLDKARIRGVELSAGAEIDDWTLAAALTYTDPEDRETGNQLRRRASQSLRLDLDRELGDWSLGGSWVVQNHRYDDADNEERLAGFGLLNLRAGWDFAPGWSTRLTVENVLDRDVVTARDFSGNDYLNAGRAAFLSLHFGG